MPSTTTSVIFFNIITFHALDIYIYDEKFRGRNLKFVKVVNFSDNLSFVERLKKKTHFEQNLIRTFLKGS